MKRKKIEITFESFRVRTGNVLWN